MDLDQLQERFTNISSDRIQQVREDILRELPNATREEQLTQIYMRLDNGEIF